MRVPYAVLAGSTVAAGGVALALMIHRTLVTCAHLVAQPGSACPAQATDYPIQLRVAIIVAGLIAASLIVVLGGVRPPKPSSRVSNPS